MPIEFGIQTAPQHNTYDELLAVWQTAEREGFEHVPGASLPRAT